MDVLADPEELGRRISAARGYAQMQRPAFAKEMGVSVPTLIRYEKGEVGSLGDSIEQRRQVAERAMRVSGCPPEIIGFAEPPSDQRLDALEREVRALHLRMASQIDVEELGDPTKIAEAEAAAAELANEEESLRKAEEAAEVDDDQAEEPGDTAEPRK